MVRQEAFFLHSPQIPPNGISASLIHRISARDLALWEVTVQGAEPPGSPGDLNRSLHFHCQNRSRVRLMIDPTVGVNIKFRIAVQNISSLL